MTAETILHEVECLASEIFASTYNMDWGQAVTEAICQFREMQDYARDWDASAAAESRIARQVALLKLTNCSPEQAIDAVRAADGKPAWSEVLA